VKDLHECLSRTQLKPALARNLRSTLEARLLHQGATTEDILIAYVSAIRAFGVLDPSGVLLDAACAPIKQVPLFSIPREKNLISAAASGWNMVARRPNSIRNRT